MKPLYIAFVWHQHQPYYKNPETGKYLLPWVRLHCTKDYYDMAAILEKYPSIKQTINITPSLMEQIIDYTNGATDDFLDVSKKPAKELTKEERIFILKNFFMANPTTMIEPYPRYNELFRRRGLQGDDNYLKRIEPLFSTSDMRDLVVWFNLSWVDPYFRQNNEKIKKLYKTEKNFTEEDKQTLLDETAKIIKQVLPKHKEMQDKGQIEVTTSPYYHPILPLLIDTSIAKIGMPFVTLPKTRYNQPDDAETQIKNGCELYEKIFKTKPRGMWPSEGSVSSDIVPMIAKNGIFWIATDEEILFRTLGNSDARVADKNELLYKPYKITVGSHSVSAIFRDHELSDLVGFVYHKADAADAANDFIGRLKEIQNSFANNNGNGTPPIVSIILDGENCWEYYKNDGADFLNALYAKLTNEEENGLITTTVSGYLSKFPPKDELKGIFPGSWINGNFGIWIGHPEDNQAWDALNQTRKFLQSRTPKINPPENIKKAWEEIYIAEGSDWNWWYGADHSSMNDAEFDQLFRSHLINVYKLLNEKVPDSFYFSIKRKWETIGSIVNPVDFVKPKIDGRVTSFFEWHNAGFYDVSKSGGAMHQTDTCLKMIYWGFDETNLYFRLDCLQPFLKDILFKIIFLKPVQKNLTIDPHNNSAVFGTDELKNIAIGKRGIIEFSLPFLELGTEPGEFIEFVVITAQKELDLELELERWPYHASIILTHPAKNFSEEHWSV